MKMITEITIQLDNGSTFKLSPKEAEALSKELAVIFEEKKDTEYVPYYPWWNDRYKYPFKNPYSPPPIFYGDYSEHITTTSNPEEHSAIKLPTTFSSEEVPIEMKTLGDLFNSPEPTFEAHFDGLLIPKENQYVTMMLKEGEHNS